MSSREYAIALQYVQQHYAELYRCADFITVVPAQRFPACQEGQCSGDNIIVISNAIKTVGGYINVLVHELTHAHQNVRRAKLTDLQREEEAYAAGNLAAEQYLTKAAPWAQKGGR